MRLLDKSASKEQLIDILNSMKFPIMGAGGGFAPLGTINFFDASIAPQGWLACDGGIYNIADYPELATFYASVHGASNFYGGDGTTTFAVPDLRGEFLRGTGTNSHENQGDGANVGIHQDATEANSIGYSSEGGKQFTTFSATTDRWTGYKNPDKELGTPKTGNWINTYGGITGGTRFDAYASRPTNTSFLICVKATVSDAEINAFNVYTPREHQVGWWEEEIDGVWKRKPVYEKEINGITPVVQDSDFEVMNITSLSIERVVQMRGTFGDNSGGIAEINYLDKYANVYSYIYNNVLHMTTKNRNRADQYTIQLRYTKTTDQWQTS